jgi:hypothetical protein
MNKKYDIGIITDLKDIMLKKSDKDLDYDDGSKKLPEIEFSKVAMEIIEYFENKNIMEER